MSDLADVLDLLMRIARGEAGAHLDLSGEPSEADDTLAAIVGGLNMLAEEIDHERAMRAQAEQLLADERDAYDRSPALLCSVDTENLKILRANESLERTLGVARGVLVGRPVASLFAERDREAAEAALRAAASGAAQAFPELLLAPSRRVTSDVSLSDDGRRLRLVWHDVTRERLLEGQLVHAQKMQAIGRLSGGIAHDFNNILAIIMASASIARSTISPASDAYQDLIVIEQATQRGAGLTSQLLAFSRQQIVRPQLVELGTMVRDVDRMLRRLISENIELSLVIDDESLIVRIDPAQLTQVLVNLVVNARDALGERGRILIEVARVELDETYADVHLDVAPGWYAMISVSDDGAGMPPEVLSQIFEPFFTTKAPGEGSGLGLSVCYGIVRQANGYIWAYSELHKGTTIKVYLPLEQGTQSAGTGASPEVQTGRERILLVEDDAVLRRLTQRMLERAGYHVTSVANGIEAIDTSKHEAPFDLLISDVVMPGMGGRELSTRLLHDQRVRAVLYISGYTANSIVHGGVLDPDIHFLSKPFTSDQLLRAVRGAIDT